MNVGYTGIRVYSWRFEILGMHSIHGRHATDIYIYYNLSGEWNFKLLKKEKKSFFI